MTPENIREFHKKYKIPAVMSISLAAWIILAFGYEKPGDLTPAICALMAILISNTYKPLQAAGIAFPVGYQASLIWGGYLIINGVTNSSRVEIFGGFVGALLFIVFNTLSFVFIGFLYGGIAILITRRAIF